MKNDSFIFIWKRIQNLETNIKIQSNLSYKPHIGGVGSDGILLLFSSFLFIRSINFSNSSSFFIFSSFLILSSFFIFSSSFLFILSNSSSIFIFSSFLFFSSLFLSSSDCFLRLVFLSFSFSCCFHIFHLLGPWFKGNVHGLIFPFFSSSILLASSCFLLASISSGSKEGYSPP